MQDDGSRPTRTMTVVSASSGHDHYLVEARAVVCGSSISVVFGGGTHYHIGAAALAIPRPSLADENQISASASVICVTGHKEDELARRAALMLASNFNCVVNVAVGIHLDNATREDISMLVSNFNQALHEIERGLRKCVTG